MKRWYFFRINCNNLKLRWIKFLTAILLGGTEVIGVKGINFSGGEGVAGQCTYLNNC